jgi:hypothetical protein
MTRIDVLPTEPGSSDDDRESTEPLTGAPAKVLALLENASAFAAEGEMETVDRILVEVVDVIRRAAPALPPEAWADVRRRHDELQTEIDKAAERIRAQLGAAGGGRKAVSRYGATTPPVWDEEEQG